MYYSNPGGQCDHCQAALTKDYFSIVSSQKQRQALLSIIDERTYSEIRGKGEFSLGIPLLDGLISAGADWEQFSRAQRSYLEQVGWNSELNHTIKQLQVVTSPIAYKYWSECVQKCAQNQYGFHGWITAETKDAVMVTMYFKGTSESPPVRLGGTVIGGIVDGLPQGKLFADGAELKSGDTLGVIIKRVEGTTMTVGVTPSSYEGFLFYSEWGKGVRELGDLTVEIICTVKEERFTTTLSSNQVATPNHHNDDSDGEPRSPDRKWRASDVTLSVQASPGRILRSPELLWKIPHFSFPRGITFEEGSGNPSPFTSILNLGIMAGETTAVATVRTWTGPIIIWLTAKEYEVTDKTSATSNTVTMARRRPLEVRVPRGAEATLKLVVEGSVSVCKAGQDSNDGVLRCLSSVSNRAGTLYVYQYE